MSFEEKYQIGNFLTYELKVVDSNGPKIRTMLCTVDLGSSSLESATCESPYTDYINKPIYPYVSRGDVIDVNALIQGLTEWCSPTNSDPFCEWSHGAGNTERLIQRLKTEKFSFDNNGVIGFPHGVCSGYASGLLKIIYLGEFTGEGCLPQSATYPFSVPLSSVNLQPGSYTLTVTATDTGNNVESVSYPMTATT